jgi:hypothetical protein
MNRIAEKAIRFHKAALQEGFYEKSLFVFLFSFLILFRVPQQRYFGYNAS